MITVLTTLMLLTTLQCDRTVAENGGADEELLPPADLTYYDPNENDVSKSLPLANQDPKLDTELEQLSQMLVNVLEESWGPGGVPLLYVEDEPSSNTAMEMEMAPSPWKRSRYYRRYPWKRQNSRSRTRYEVDNPYMCQPSREDVFKLLVALHETRAGNSGRSINFCNRRRSAGAIFTNIRFLGRK